MKNIKKIVSVLMAVSMITGLSACARQTSKKVEKPQPEEEIKEEKEEEKESTPFSVSVDMKGDYRYDTFDSSVMLCRAYFPSYQISEPRISEKGLVTGLNNEKYAPLQATLDKISEAEKDKAKKTMNQLEEYARKDREQDSFSDAFSYETTGEVVRADDKLVSIWQTEYLYAGGAHPNTFNRGINIDTETGKEIPLPDMIKDKDKFVSLVAAKIREEYPRIDEVLSVDSLEEGIEENIPTVGYVFTGTGMDIIFSTYALCIYAGGEQEISIDNSEFEGIIDDKYVYEPKSYWRELPQGKSTVIKDESGEKVLSWYFDIPADGQGYALLDEAKMMINLNGQSFEFPENGSYGARAFLSHVKDKNFLFVEYQHDNDYRTTVVYDLNKDTVTTNNERAADFSRYGDLLETGFYNMSPVSLDSFLMCKRTDTLSTRMIGRMYKLGKKGYPEPLTDYFYYVADEDLESGKTLKTKTELTMQIVETPDGKGEETKVPAGSKLTLYATDEISFVVFMGEDGKLYKAELKKDEFGDSIGGQPATTVLDNMFFAG